MAALLASTDLEGGKRLELYEGGLLYIIDGPHQQEIKLLPGAALDVLAFLAEWKEQLDLAQAQRERELEETYGELYRFSEHKRGEHISYRTEGLTRSGEILWVQGPGETVKQHLHMGVHYIVAPDEDTGFVDIVFVGDVLEATEKE